MTNPASTAETCSVRFKKALWARYQSLAGRCDCRKL